jgi:hypothetical protein
MASLDSPVPAAAATSQIIDRLPNLAVVAAKVLKRHPDLTNLFSDLAPNPVVGAANSVQRRPATAAAAAACEDSGSKRQKTMESYFPPKST